VSPNPLSPHSGRWGVPVYGEPVPAHLGPWPRAEVDVSVRNVRGRFARGRAALATDLTVSVIPPDVLTMLGVAFTPDPLWAGFAVDPWCGVPCDIGRIAVQFPVPGRPPPQMWFYIQVRRPVGPQLPWMGTRLLLGSEFMTRSRAEWWLDYARFTLTGAQIGVIEL
jgi:hypothetical protein